MIGAGKKRPKTRMRFRLTLAGWLFLAVACLVGLAAVKNQTSLMYVMFGGMMGALHISAVIARKTINKIDVLREAPSRVWQNQVVHLGYYLTSGRRRGSSLAVHLKEVTLEGMQFATTYCVQLLPRGSFRSGGRFTAMRRGRISFQGVRLYTSFPFGLVEASRYLPMESSLSVWPACGKLTSRLLHHGAAQISSLAASPVAGGQDEFFGLREYREGDNPRWIHWRRSAGKRIPVVREMSQPFPEILYLILDTQLPADQLEQDDVLECHLRFAATLIDHAFSRGYQVGLALAFSSNVNILPPTSGRGQLHALLDTLAAADRNTDQNLARVISATLGSVSRQCQVVLLSRNLRSLPAMAVAQLKARCGHLTVLEETTLGRYFQDEPLSVKEPSNAPA